jgi:hypothetical protein
LAIKPACEAAGATCGRVDQQIFLRSILDRIYGEIDRATVLVAEMSDHNPNVFYEVGYAHGLGKPVILVTKSADDIPFDLRHYPHIVHGGSLTTLREKLEETVRWCLTHPEELVAQSPPYADKARQAFAQIGTHIKNYLAAHNFEMVSFERVRENINPDYSDDVLQRLIEHFPTEFRRARLQGGKPGIALVAP